MSSFSSHASDEPTDPSDDGAPHAARLRTPARSMGGAWLRRIITTLVIVAGLLTLGYTAISTYVATRLVYLPPKPLVGTPSQYGLTYTDVTFPAREDGVMLKGWYIPGVLPDGRLTSDRTLIMIHGTRTNRTDPAMGLLRLSAALAHHGFGVLAFDMRGTGESPPAPLSLGYFEQRDALGAVDFLRSGQFPYPELGRPRVIAGWGVSMGAATLLLAAAQEPAIRAVVSDCAYAAIAPILEREVPAQGGLPPFFTPGALVAAQALYGMNFYAVRPVDVIGRIAPRPILLIHGAVDDYIPPSNMSQLYAAASAAPNAQVEQWLVPGAKHAQSFNVAGGAYVARVVTFLTTALGPDQSVAG